MEVKCTYLYLGYSNKSTIGWVTDVMSTYCLELLRLEVQVHNHRTGCLQIQV